MGTSLFSVLWIMINLAKLDHRLQFQSMKSHLPNTAKSSYLKCINEVKKKNKSRINK